jgi:hypothetical protein
LINGYLQAGDRRVDQLAGDAHAVAGLAHAAFEHVTHPQLARYLLHVSRLAFARETRIARGDEQPGGTVNL